MDNQQKMKTLVMIGAIFWIIGLLMILAAFYNEFFGELSQVADSTSSKLLMTMKLGGIGFTLSGIFLALVAIVKALTMIPEKLGQMMKK
jgi:hypothetical protein